MNSAMLFIFGFFVIFVTIFWSHIVYGVRIAIKRTFVHEFFFTDPVSWMTKFFKVVLFLLLSIFIFYSFKDTSIALGILLAVVKVSLMSSVLYFGFKFIFDLLDEIKSSVFLSKMLEKESIRNHMDDMDIETLKSAIKAYHKALHATKFIVNESDVERIVFIAQSLMENRCADCVDRVSINGSEASSYLLGDVCQSMADDIMEKLNERNQLKTG